LIIDKRSSLQFVFRNFAEINGFAISSCFCAAEAPPAVPLSGSVGNGRVKSLDLKCCDKKLRLNKYNSYYRPNESNFYGMCDRKQDYFIFGLVEDFISQVNWCQLFQKVFRAAGQ
jgi:hypothetical protein